MLESDAWAQPSRNPAATAMYQTVRHLLEHGMDPRRLWWLRLDHPLLLREELGSLVRSKSGVGTLPLDLLLVACGRQAAAALATRLAVSD